MPFIGRVAVRLPPLYTVKARVRGHRWLAIYGVLERMRGTTTVTIVSRYLSTITKTTPLRLRVRRSVLASVLDVSVSTMIVCCLSPDRRRLRVEVLVMMLASATASMAAGRLGIDSPWVAEPRTFTVGVSSMTSRTTRRLTRCVAGKPRSGREVRAARVSCVTEEMLDVLLVGLATSRPKRQILTSVVSMNDVRM